MGDSKKTKLPKQIAGVKLPKKLRKKANKALDALDQPLVRNLAQVALAAASAAAAKHADQSRAAADGAADKAERAAPADATGGDRPSSRHQMADVAAGLALAALTKWLSSKDKPVEDIAKQGETPTTH